MQLFDYKLLIITVEISKHIVCVCVCVCVCVWDIKSCWFIKTIQFILEQRKKIVLNEEALIKLD